MKVNYLNPDTMGGQELKNIYIQKTISFIKKEEKTPTKPLTEKKNETN